MQRCSLDLMKDYHQVKMDNNSKPKIAFVCHLGLYQYRRMPFRLTNALATFQRLMGKLFNGRILILFLCISMIYLLLH